MTKSLLGTQPNGLSPMDKISENASCLLRTQIYFVCSGQTKITLHGNATEHHSDCPSDTAKDMSCHVRSVSGFMVFFTHRLTACFWNTPWDIVFLCWHIGPAQKASDLANVRCEKAFTLRSTCTWKERNLSRAWTTKRIQQPIFFPQGLGFERPQTHRTQC